MKRYILFIGFLLSIFNVIAQKNIELKKSLKGINKVFLHADFAKNISIKNHSSNEILIKASININNNKNNDVYQLTNKTNSKTLKIKSDFGDYFKKQHNSVTYNSKDCNCNNGCNSPLVINYEITLPKHVALKVKSITGSVEAASYNGDLTLDLISGNITLKNHAKTLELKTISGDIDVIVTNANFKAKTVTGNVYSNLDLDFNNNSKGMERLISGTIGNGKSSSSMETISGNIYLRKQ